MIERTIQDKLAQIAKQFPVITLNGPRQSGKTTLAKHLFPQHRYVNLEIPINKELANSEPYTFFQHYPGNLILDESQNAPHLFSYIQTIVDEKKQPGQFIITGSENLLLSEKINQSLAGRVYVSTLLPLSLEELQAMSINMDDYMPLLYKGFYPPLYGAAEIAPADWLPSYIQTYVERDARQLIKIKNLKKFQTFLGLCAGSIGQVMNYESLARAVGVHGTTIKEWIDMLEAMYIVFVLHPYHNNFKKRLVKSSKLYFYDTGLACMLLGIQDVQSLPLHPFRGGLFENFIIAELFKRHFNRGLVPHFYFWRDSNGVEVDCLIERAGKILPIEIKSTQALASLPTKNLKTVTALMGEQALGSYIVYGGEQSFELRGTKVVSWKDLDLLM